MIAVSGRIEGDDASVGAKTSGRIREITVREGDQVTAGQVIAVLDDAQIRAREQQSEAAVRQAEARLRVSQHQITVLNEQLLQSELGVDQSRADAQGRVDEAEARLATAEAQLAQAEASYTPSEVGARRIHAARRDGPRRGDGGQAEGEHRAEPGGGRHVGPSGRSRPRAAPS